MAKRGRPRRDVNARRLMKPTVTGSPIYYRSSRGGSWRLSDDDLLFCLDQYADGEPIADICAYFNISTYALYRNIGPYLERR